jgi:hypothetical protein
MQRATLRMRNKHHAEINRPEIDRSSVAADLCRWNRSAPARGRISQNVLLALSTNCLPDQVAIRGVSQ